MKELFLTLIGAVALAAGMAVQSRRARNFAYIKP